MSRLVHGQTFTHVGLHEGPHSGAGGKEGVFTLTDLQGLDLKTDGLGTKASRRWW